MSPISLSSSAGTFNAPHMALTQIPYTWLLFFCCVHLSGGVTTFGVGERYGNRREW